MKKIAIISSSVRDGRLSHRAALYIQKYITDNSLAETIMLDLKEYDFPIFCERLQYQTDPSAKLLDFTGKFNASDGLVIVTPVYNGSFPASIKNVIDLYYKEWYHKPVLIASVTDKSTPGIATIQQLQTILLKLGALVTPQLYTILNAGTSFDETGIPSQPEAQQKFIAPVMKEFMWLVEKSK